MADRLIERWRNLRPPHHRRPMGLPRVRHFYQVGLIEMAFSILIFAATNGKWQSGMQPRYRRPASVLIGVVFRGYGVAASIAISRARQRLTPLPPVAILWRLRTGHFTWPRCGMMSTNITQSQPSLVMGVRRNNFISAIIEAGLDDASYYRIVNNTG